VEIVVAVSGLCYLCCNLGFLLQEGCFFLLLRRICNSLFSYLTSQRGSLSSQLVV